MREHRLRALWRREFVYTTDSGHALRVSSNVLARRFDPSHANQAWVSDITHIRTRSSWLYLAARPVSAWHRCRCPWVTPSRTWSASSNRSRN